VSNNKNSTTINHALSVAIVGELLWCCCLVEQPANSPSCRRRREKDSSRPATPAAPRQFHRAGIFPPISIKKRRRFHLASTAAA
jgi:hypothetical protein